MLITGMENGTSSIQIKNSYNKSVTVYFDVVSIPKTGVVSMSLIFGVGAAVMVVGARFYKRKDEFQSKPNLRT